MTDIFNGIDPYIQAQTLTEVFKNAKITGSRLVGASLDGVASNLTADALANAFASNFDALPDKLTYARYVMTPGIIYLNFDNGRTVAVRFAGSGAVFVRQMACMPVTDANVELYGILSTVAGQLINKVEVTVTEEKPAYLCVKELLDYKNHIERIHLHFVNGKTLVIYALLDYTVAGILCGEEADQIKIKALRRILRNK